MDDFNEITSDKSKDYLVCPEPLPSLSANVAWTLTMQRQLPLTRKRGWATVIPGIKPKALDMITRTLTYVLT